MKKNKTTLKANATSLVLEKAKKLVAHQIIGGLALILVALMTFNTMNLVQAVNSGASTLNLTIGAGVLEVVNVGDVQFASGTAGVASNQYQNMNGTTVRDFRSAPTSWDLKIYSDPLTGQTDGGYTVANTSINVFPASATITNVETFDNTAVGTGSDDTSLDTDYIIFNSSYASQGVVRFDDVGINVHLNSSLIDQDYSGTATLTVVAA